MALRLIITPSHSELEKKLKTELEKIAEIEKIWFSKAIKELISNIWILLICHLEQLEKESIPKYLIRLWISSGFISLFFYT